MSSRTSRRMGLGLILAGAGALSGCLLNPNNYPGQEAAVQSYNRRQVITFGLFAATPFANTVPQAAVMNATAHVMNSNNTVRAQEFQGNSGNYTGDNSSSENQNNISRCDVFSCNEFGDRDGDEMVSDHEIINRGKTNFYVGEPYAYVVLLTNCKDKELIYFGQNAPGDQLKEKTRAIVPNNNCAFYSDGFLKEPANWVAYWTLDGVKVGENRICVREMPKISELDKIGWQESAAATKATAAAKENTLKQIALAEKQSPGAAQRTADDIIKGLYR